MLLILNPENKAMNVRQYEACLDNFCNSQELCIHKREALDRWAKGRWDEINNFTDSSQLFDLFAQGLEELTKPVVAGISLMFVWGVLSFFLRNSDYRELGERIGDIGEEIALAIWEVLKSHGISPAEVLGIQADDEADFEIFRRLMKHVPDPPEDPSLS